MFRLLMMAVYVSGNYMKINGLQSLLIARKFSICNLYFKYSPKFFLRNMPNNLYEQSLPPTITDDHIIEENFNAFKIKNFCFHPNKPWIYATNNTGFLFIWDLQAHKILFSKKIFPSKICKMSFFRTGDYLAVILATGEAFLLNSSTFFIVATIESQWLQKDQTGKYFKGIQILNDKNHQKDSKFEKKSISVCFEVISSNSSTKIRLQQIFKANEVYNATVLVNYNVEGIFSQRVF